MLKLVGRIMPARFPGNGGRIFFESPNPDRSGTVAVLASSHRLGRRRRSRTNYSSFSTKRLWVTVAASGPSGRKRLDRLLPPDSYFFQSCNLLALPFADRSFDLVVSFRLLPHVDEWSDLIAELCRVADKAVIVDYPDIRSFNFLSKFFFQRKKGG